MKYRSVVIIIVALVAACSRGGSVMEPNVTPTNRNSNAVMNNSNDARTKHFLKSLSDGFVEPTDDVGQRLLKEYGAVFVARGGAVVPKTVVFKDENEVAAFQLSAASSRETVRGVSIELQTAAMNALKNAVAEASQSGLKLTPRGADAAKRSYDDTVKLWASRVEPGLDHWTKQGRISAADTQRIKGLTPYEQVPEIFKLEEQGIYFSKDLQKTIIYSVAPPGTSQHLSMLALDVAEFDNAEVRSILAKHGWFQTVVSDLPHFTFLGLPENELPGVGLKKVASGEYQFWVPDL